MPSQIWRLRYWPDPVLRTKCTKVTDKKEALEVALQMVQIMRDSNGLGLSAPQVGYDKRVFVMRDSENADRSLIFINPEIAEYQMGETEMCKEGCLSFPGQLVRVCRPRVIDFTFESADSDEVLTWHFEGINARCVQHEIDHLNGIMIFDHIMSKVMRSITIDKYMKSRV